MSNYNNLGGDFFRHRGFWITAALIWMISNTALACSCDIRNFSEMYSEADLVMTARVLKTHPNLTPNHDSYKIDVLPLTTFKGKSPVSLYVYGSNDLYLRSSCDQFVFPSSTWIIYAYQAEDGTYRFGECSGSREISPLMGYPYNRYPKIRANYLKSLTQEMSILSFLKNEQIQNTNEYYLSPTGLVDYVEALKGQEFRREFAFYEISLDDNLKVISVDVLKPFSEPIISKKIAQYLRESVSWKIVPYAQVEKQAMKLILGLYAYPSENDKEGFISLRSR